MTQAIDLTGYSVASTDGRSVFAFPRKYTLLAGDQVTIWCSPGVFGGGGSCDHEV